VGVDGSGQSKKEGKIPKGISREKGATDVKKTKGDSKGTQKVAGSVAESHGETDFLAIRVRRSVFRSYTAEGERGQLDTAKGRKGQSQVVRDWGEKQKKKLRGEGNLSGKLVRREKHRQGPKKA